MRRVVIHVGLPKTGSTTLQAHVFPNIAGIDYLGPKGAQGRDLARAEAAEAVVEALQRDARSLAEGRVDDGLARLRDRLIAGAGTLLLSEETLTSNARFFEAGFDPIPFVPAAIRTLFPEATVVLVLREPAAWVGSMLMQRMFDRPLYRQVAGGHEPIGPIAYIDADLAAVLGRDASIFATSARFDRTVAAYRAAFPPERLRVLAFERLFGPEEGWRAAFAGLLGVPVSVPTPPRSNPTTDDKPRAIAVQFFRGDVAKVDRFVEKWRRIVSLVQGHRRAMRVLSAHAEGPWQEAMAAGQAPAIAPPGRIGENA